MATVFAKVEDGKSTPYAAVKWHNVQRLPVYSGEMVKVEDNPRHMQAGDIYFVRCD